MFGQKHLIQRIVADGIPSTMIIVGDIGSGRHTLLKEVCHKLNYEYVALMDSKAETIRNVIQESNKIVGKDILYVIPDCESMSPASKNALLKVTEEPPNRSSFALITTALDRLPDTLQSRSRVYEMDVYQRYDLESYMKSKYKVSETSTILSIAETPGDIDLLVYYGTSFIDYVNLVKDNILTTSEANSFKIGSKIALKKDAEGFDLRLFWKGLIAITCDDLKSLDSDMVTRAINMIRTTSQYLQHLDTNGINMQMLFDMWIISVRENNA